MLKTKELVQSYNGNNDPATGIGYVFVGGNAQAVSRIDPKNGERKEYPSMTAASNDGFSLSCVSACVLGRLKTHGGYIWCYPGEQPSLDVVSKPKVNWIIERIDQKTGEVKEYHNTTDIKNDGFSHGNVLACCNGQRGSHKGYRWQYRGHPIAFKSKAKRVRGTNISTGEVLVYENKLATQRDGFVPSKVGSCCLGRRKTHKGYIWEEIDD